MSVMTIPLRSQRESVSIPRVNDLPWDTKTISPAAVPGPAKKILSRGTGGALHPDPDVVQATWLTHISPWWRDPELVYHPCVEEAYILNGTVQLGDRVYGPGSYLYRPPGILHGPAFIPSDIGATLFQRFQDEGGILRYNGDEFPHVDCQPVTDEYKTWPVEWVEYVDSETIPWAPLDSGPWEGASRKWLSRNRETGGGTLLLDIPAGWSGVGTTGRATAQEFIISGNVTVGGMFFERWGYTCRAPGEAAGSYTSNGGARLICIWDEDEATA